MKPKRKDSVSGRSTPLLPPPEDATGWLSTFQSYLGTTSKSTDHAQTPKSPSALAWLDGYRGLAAIGVFNFHFFTVYTDSIITGYGFNDEHQRIAELPFIRLLADGGTMVNVFFIVSGYVCSLNALKAMEKTDIDRALRGLSSSIFRRYFRLYLPVFAVTLITAVCAQIGVFDVLRHMFEQKRLYFPGQYVEPSLTHYANPWDQFKFWLSEMITLSNPWSFTPFYPIHDPHLWTIQFEFRMSMYLYLSLVGLSRCRAKVRMLILCGLGILHFLCNHWEGPLFYTGAVLAQYDVIRAEQARTNTSTSPDRLPSHHHNGQRAHNNNNINNNNDASRSSLHRILRSIAYIVSFYFMTYPIAGHKRAAPGYMWMTELIPAWYNRKEKLPKTIGVVLLTYLLCTARNNNNNTSTSTNPTTLSTSARNDDSNTSQLKPHQPQHRLPFLHRIFVSGLALFAGKHMFGLYLVHGPILHAVGYGIPHAIWGTIGQDSKLTYLTGLMVGWSLSLTLCLGVAVLFHRHIEPRCAAVTKQLESFCFDDDTA